MFSAGDGTKQNPYRVASVEDFLLINDYPTACFLQTQDIDFTGTEMAPFTIDFTGVYDGGGYELQNITIRGNSKVGEDVVNGPVTIHASTGTGIFVVATYATFQNIRMVNTLVYPARSDDSANQARTGVLCTAMRGCTVTNCHIEAEVTDIATTSGDSAGVAAFANTFQSCVMKKCSAKLTVTNTGFVGGLVVWNNGEIYDSYCFVNVGTTMYLGTVIYSQGSGAKVVNCYSVVNFENAKYPYLPCNNSGPNDGIENTFFDCNKLGGPAWDETKYYYTGDLVQGTDGNLYKCIKMQSDKDYNYWEPDWQKPPEWWPPAMTKARPVDGSDYAEYWEQVGPDNTEGAKTTADLQTLETFTGWDFTGVWTIEEGFDYPRLKTHDVCTRMGLVAI